MRTPFESRFAADATITSGQSTVTVRAFLWPVSVTKPDSPVFSPAGLGDERRWKILLPPMTPEELATVTVKGEEYTLLRWETMADRHVEGILCRKPGDADAE